MRTKYLDAVALFCAFAYALSLGFGTYRLGRTISERRVTAEREFAELVDRSSSAAVLGFMDAPFRETVRDTVHTSRALAAAIVTGPSGPEYAIERAPGYLARVDGGISFAVAFGVSAPPLFAPLRAGGVRNTTVSATALVLDAAELTAILRDTLVAIASIAMLAAIFLIVDLLKGAPTEERPADETVSSEPAKAEDADDFEIDIPDLADDIVADITVGEASPEPTSETDAAEPLHGDATAEVGDEPPPAPAEISTAAPSDAADAPDSKSESVPAGLYSPRGDIGWEAYVADRLASELHRCASFEQDLVLLVMEPQDGGPEWEAAFAEFAESTVSFFTFRDLVFERGRLGVSVILPNVNLDHGLRMADEFRSKLRKGPTPAIAGADLRIGLTARSGRLVDAERLRLEASRALEKAIEEDNSPVVAFKPDPDRYRSFIAARS